MGGVSEGLSGVTDWLTASCALGLGITMRGRIRRSIRTCTARGKKGICPSLGRRVKDGRTGVSSTGGRKGC